MTDEIKIWAIDNSSGEVVEVEPINRTETEQRLEDVLVENPDMLMSGLTLVGRQTPAAGGALDLLGVDGDGKLVVFELKRSAATRDAVAQVIDYCSYLDSLTYSQLGELISKNSGSGGIESIIDFEEWYLGNSNGKELTELKPIRMALVGVGIDENATRMVNFLADRDVDISLLSFSAYLHHDRTLLAKQVQQVEAGAEPQSNRYIRREKRRTSLDERARTIGIDSFWHEVIGNLTRVHRGDPAPRANGYTFYQNPLKLPGLVGGHRAGASHTVRLDEDQKIRVTFFPVAVHLCETQFKHTDVAGLFETQASSHFQSTDRVKEEYYCVLDEAGWKKHKGSLLSLVDEINRAWGKAFQEIAESVASARLDA